MNGGYGSGWPASPKRTASILAAAVAVALVQAGCGPSESEQAATACVQLRLWCACGGITGSGAGGSLRYQIAPLSPENLGLLETMASDREKNAGAVRDFPVADEKVKQRQQECVQTLTHEAKSYRGFISDIHSHRTVSSSEFRVEFENLDSACKQMADDFIATCDEISGR